MDERQFYSEKEETRKVKLVCPSCRGEFEAPVRWKVCRKKKELPRGIGEEDRKKFAKASSYMVRLDDLVACYKCRKRFEFTPHSPPLTNDNLPHQHPRPFHHFAKLFPGQQPPPVNQRQLRHAILLTLAQA